MQNIRYSVEEKNIKKVKKDLVTNRSFKFLILRLLKPTDDRLYNIINHRNNTTGYGRVITLFWKMDTILIFFNRATLLQPNIIKINFLR